MWVRILAAVNSPPRLISPATERVRPGGAMTLADYSMMAFGPAGVAADLCRWHGLIARQKSIAAHGPALVLNAGQQRVAGAEADRTLEGFTCAVAGREFNLHQNWLLANRKRAWVGGEVWKLIHHGSW